MTESKFNSRYEFKGNHDGDWKIYRPLGKIRGIKVNSKIMSQLGIVKGKKEFYIIANWGEKMIVKKNDYLVSPLDNSEVYRIAEKEFFETYRMTYALVDNNFFLCFKALGKENTVEGMKTKRFEDVLKGLPFTMSKKMSAEISKLNLKTFPPILFVGFKKTTDFIDFVNLQYYYGGGIALEYGIREVSNVNTDNILKTKNKQNGEAESDSAIA